MKTSQSTQDYTRWNLPKGAKARIGDGYITGKIAYSPDGTQLVVPKSTGIWVYDTSTFEVIDLISEHRAFNSTEIRNNQWCELIEVDNAVRFSSEGKLFAVRVAWQYCVLPPTSEIYTIRIWSREIEQPELISIKCPEKIDSMVFSPDGLTLAGSKDGIIYLWNVHTGELQNILTVKAKKIDSMVFSPDGLTLASTSWIGTGQFGISPDGDTYESIHSSIDVWDIRTGRHKFNLYADSFLGFSPDGQMLAGRIYGDSVALRDADTGTCKFTFTHYDTSLGSATSLAFSPDGLTLASFSNDTIHLWDYRTGNCKSTFTGIGYITSLVFSPNGLSLAGGCEDGTVLLWDIDISIDETSLTNDNPFIIPESIDSDNNEIALEERDTEFQNRESQIQKICEDRSITTLVHFTQIKHLQSILYEGLLDHQSLLEKHGQQFVPNDPKRLDRHKEAICLSISFPNYLLFNKFSRPNTGSPPDYSQWIVLLLDAKVLWELDCAFCQENAASNAVRHISWKEKKKTDALESIFIEEHRDINGTVYQRHSPRIPQHYPTHPQAEVLVRSRIGPEYIKEVHFYDETALEQWRYSNPRNYPPRLTVNQQYFQYGRDQIVCEDDNLDDDIPPAPPPEDDNLDDVISF